MIVMQGKETEEVEFNLTSGGLPLVRTVDGKGGGRPPPPIVSPEGSN